MIHYLLTQEADPCLILKRTLTRAFGTPWRRDVPCDSPVRECWEWHIRPRLKSPRSSAGGIGARALCPAHDDREPSLSIGIGDNGRITWQCFACKNRKLVRAALIRECGIDPGCLPLVAREKEELLDYITRLATGDRSHAEVRLRVVAAVNGYEDLPRGRELDRLAGLARVSRGEAYKFRKRGRPARTDNPGSYSPAADAVKPRRSA